MYTLKIFIKIQEKITNPFVKFFYEKLGIKPNTLTLVALILGIVAALFFYLNDWYLAYLFLAVSIIFDSFDGAMARKYKLTSDKGELLDKISDRTVEFFVYIALVLNGSVSFLLFLLAYFAIILNTLLQKRSKLDLGFRRAVLFLGIIINFNIVFTIIFSVNLLCFILQLIIINKVEKKKWT